MLYGVLYVSVKNDLIQLPPSISARLLPLADEKKIEPPKPLPPPPSRNRKYVDRKRCRSRCWR